MIGPRQSRHGPAALKYAESDFFVAMLIRIRLKAPSARAGGAKPKRGSLFGSHNDQGTLTRCPGA